MEIDQRLVVLFMIAVVSNLFWISLKAEQIAERVKPKHNRRDDDHDKLFRKPQGPRCRRG